MTVAKLKNNQLLFLSNRKTNKLNPKKSKTLSLKRLLQPHQWSHRMKLTLKGPHQSRTKTVMLPFRLRMAFSKREAVQMMQKKSSKNLSNKMRSLDRTQIIAQLRLSSYLSGSANGHKMPRKTGVTKQVTAILNQSLR